MSQALVIAHRRGRQAAVTFALAGALAAAGCSKNGDGGEAPATKVEASAPVAATPPAAAAPAEPSAPAQPAADVPLDRAETDSYIVEIIQPAEVSAGAEVKLSVRIQPKAHWHFNLDFPTSVTVVAPEGVAVAKDKQTLEHAMASSKEEGATWEISVTAAEPGARSLTADLKFAVCTDTTCDPKKQTVAFSLDAK